MATSSILYCSPDSSLFLIDIPRSIEESQGHPESSPKRLISSKPQETPFRSQEPRSAKAKANASPIAIEDLLLGKRLEFALQELRDNHEGPLCLPRITENIRAVDTECSSRKRQKISHEVTQSPQNKKKITSTNAPSFGPGYGSFYHENLTSTSEVTRSFTGHETAIIPSGVKLFSGEISSTRTSFISQAPKFSLIVLDPPWPNRSARRSKSYTTSYSTPDIHQLLSSLPLKSHILPKGHVAIWITNKSAFHEMVLGEEGLFEQWGVKLVEEWVWLKTTKEGEPICKLDSTWRKPYEILLVGKRIRVKKEAEEVKRRVMVGVPDLHSRKPNLKHVFEKSGLLETGPDVNGLEIFARNLTAGWWAWGNEVLKFQMEDCWVDSPAPAVVQNPIDIPHFT